MQLEEIKTLMSQMRAHNIATLEWEQEGMRLRLVQQPAAMSPAPATKAPLPEPADEREEAVGEDSQLVEIRSPVVGIYYAAPSPDSAPFVEIGSVVEAGKPLCIVEAMKLLNEVTAPCAGTIVEIGGENGASVEYGQVLFRLRPADERNHDY